MKGVYSLFGVDDNDADLHAGGWYCIFIKSEAAAVNAQTCCKQQGSFAWWVLMRCCSYARCSDTLATVDSDRHCGLRHVVTAVPLRGLGWISGWAI